MELLKQHIKKSLQQAVAKRNYRLIPEWELSDIPLVAQLKALFDTYSIDMVLDVGGNLGQYRGLLRKKVGFSGEIVTFEPVPRYYEHLQKEAEADPHWHVEACALGREQGRAEINVTDSPGLNSFLSPSSEAVGDFWETQGVAQTQEVVVDTLDDVLARRGIDPQTRSLYLKLDTQGFDLEVLAGATRCLPHIKGMQTEASVQAIYEGMPGYRQTLDALDGYGFDISGMFPVSHDRFHRLIEFDCVAVNRRFAVSPAS